MRLESKQQQPMRGVWKLAGDPGKARTIGGWDLLGYVCNACTNK